MHRPLFLLAILLFVPACRTAPPPQAAPDVYPGEAWAYWSTPEAAGFDADGLAAARAYLATLNTFSVLVVRGGRVALAYGDVDSLSYLASVRKSVLAMLYGTYVADGTIDLDRTLADLGMDDVQGLSDAERQATVAHLVTARSGIYHPASNPGDDLAAAPPRGSQAPGAYFLYSNWDFNAAGAAFERATGRDLYDALDTDLARPLGFEDWIRSIHEKTGDLERSRYPAYHMVLSTRDMARLGLLMLREGRWRDRQVVPADWARRIVRAVTPREEMNPPALRDGPFGYGVMWWVWDGPEAVGPYRGAYTARGAYGQYLTVLPALDLVVAHKTLPDRRRSVSWPQYQGVLDRLVAAVDAPGGPAAGSGRPSYSP